MKLTECIRANIKLTESDRNKLPESVLSRATYCICNLGEKNANGRVYEKEVWEKVLSDSELQQKMADRCLFGHAEHPAETQSDLRETSHIIHAMWIDEASNKVYQTVDVVDTPTGRIVDCLLRAGSKVGMSTRAEGDLEEVELGEGVKVQRVVPESYQYKTTDFTADPSTYNVEPLDVRMNVAKTLQKELENKHMKAGDRVFATKLLESLQVDEASVSINVEDEGQQSNIQITGDMPTNVTTGGGVNVNITPPAPVVDPMNTGVGMPAVDGEEEVVGEEPEPEPEMEDELALPAEDEEEKPFESKVKESEEDNVPAHSRENWDLIAQTFWDGQEYDDLSPEEQKKVRKYYNKLPAHESVDEATPERDALLKDFKRDWEKFGWEDEEEAIQKYSTMNDVSTEELRQLLGKNEKCKESKKMKESVANISSFEAAGLMTGDLGFVMELDNGQKFNVTIQEDKRHGRDGDVDVAEVFEFLTALVEENADELGFREDDIPESKSFKSKINALKIAEATARAECDSLIEELESMDDFSLQANILQDRIKKIQETAQEEVDALRSLLESKLQEAKKETKSLQESKSTSEAKLDQIHKKQQESLVEAASIGKSSGRNEVLCEYFDTRLAKLHLKVDTNTRALLEECVSLQDVDCLLDKIVGLARRDALHPEKIQEIKIQEKVKVSREDQATQGLLQGLLSQWK